MSWQIENIINLSRLARVAIYWEVPRRSVPCMNIHRSTKLVQLLRLPLHQVKHLNLNICFETFEQILIIEDYVKEFQSFIDR